jgi:hypothetical protein
MTKNKLLIPIVIIAVVISVALLINFGLIYIFSTNFFDGKTAPIIEVKNGKFFDDSGKQLGLCKVESKLEFLADMPVRTIYYYDLNKNDIGHCGGEGIGCTVSLKKEPQICEPISLQKPCDKSLHPVEFGATARYRCIVE